MTPSLLVLEHEPACPPALLGEWLADAGCRLTPCRPWAGEEVPPLSAYDGWLVLGGSVGAHDDAEAPWLPTVRARVAEAAGTGVPVLGVCLGHQLAAVATGGEVAVNPAGQRVGLVGVGWTAAAADDPLLGPLASPRRALQWNSDVVVRLPEGARLLAALPGGEVQAARFAPSVWGVQWHPEVDREVLTSWAAGDRDDHLERGIDQEAVLAEVAAARDELEAAWRPLADSFAALLGLAAGAGPGGAP